MDRPGRHRRADGLAGDQLRPARGSRKPRGQPPGDAGHFYYAARALSEGTDPYKSWRHGYIYPPLVAFLYQPFGAMPIAPALVVMLVFNLVLILGSVLLLSAELQRRLPAVQDWHTWMSAAAVAFVLSFDKLRGETQHWQTNVLLLAGFVLALRWLDRRPWAAGAALGFAFNVKYLALGFLPWLLIRRRWQASGAFVASAVVFALLPAVQTGWTENVRQNRVAYAGLLRMMGVNEDVKEAANVEELRAGFSISVTSGIAKTLWWQDLYKWLGPALVATVLLSLGAVVLTYRLRGVALFGPAGRGPPAEVQAAVEWAALIAGVLAFSPQTNPRHLCILVGTNMVAVYLAFLPGIGRARWWAVAGIVAMSFGCHYPFGGDMMSWERFVVQQTGLAGWSVLAMGLLMPVAGLAAVRMLQSGGSDGGGEPAAKSTDLAGRESAGSAAPATVPPVPVTG